MPFEFDNSYPAAPAPALLDNPAAVEAAVVASALNTISAARSEILPLLPDYSFRDRKHGKAFYNIVKILRTLPDDYNDAELATLAGVKASLIIDLRAEESGFIPLKVAITNLLTSRLIADSKQGLDVTPWAAAITQLSEVGTGGATGGQPKRSPFVNLADMDLDGNMAPVYLIDKTVEENSLMVMFGPSGHGKTFVKLDMAMSIATGTPWNGRSVKQGVVVYLCGEGHGGIKRRIKAWIEHHAVTQPDTLILTRYAVPFDAEAFSTVTAAAREASERSGLPVRLFVVDTLDRHIDGDENKTPDMGRFVRVADSLKQEFPGSVVSIVHHTGKADYATGRGASNLKASADTECRCMDYTLAFTKMKDGEPPAPIQFRLIPVQIGTFEDGEGQPITSCIVDYGTQPVSASLSTKLNHHEKQALQALITVCAAENHCNPSGQYVGSIEAWREEFYRLRRIEEPDAKTSALKVAFQRVRGAGKDGGGLKDKGVIGYTTDGVVLLLLDDQAAVKSTIIATDGTRNTDGTETVHVPTGGAEQRAEHTPIIYRRVPSVPSPRHADNLKNTCCSVPVPAPLDDLDQFIKPGDTP